MSARPTHALCCRVSDALAVALLAHGAECSRAELTAAGSAPSGGGGDSEGASFLAVFGRMLANASSKASKVPDEENYPAGEDGRHSLLRSLVSALSRVVRCAAVTAPQVCIACVFFASRNLIVLSLLSQVAFWALNQLTSAWVRHTLAWHWAYQVFFEQFSLLGAQRSGGGGRGALEQLLASDPAFAADAFFVPLIRANIALLTVSAAVLDINTPI